MRYFSRPPWFAWFVFLGLCPLLLTQSGGGQDMQSGVNPGGSVTNPLQIAVTGCLKRGAGGEYYIADKNGTTWKLVPNGVNLGEHVNHSVMVTGKPATNAEQQGSNEQGGKPQVGLRVLTVDLNRVSQGASAGHIRLQRVMNRAVGRASDGFLR